MTTVISMWSGPRNISTAMMRSFASRADVAAVDEPFYAEHLTRTGAVHPYRDATLAAYPSTFEGVCAWIAQKRAAPKLFLKHIAYHLPEAIDLSFLRGWRNFLLIREPRAMVASFADKFEDVTPIVRSYEVAVAILDYLTAEGLPCPIIDAADVLASPEPMLRSLCAALDIPFDRAMLSWPAGERPEDGPWAPHWYGAVRASTGFKRSEEKEISLSKTLEQSAVRAMPSYSALHARRLMP